MFVGHIGEVSVGAVFFYWAGKVLVGEMLSGEYTLREYFNRIVQPSSIWQ
jgi:hypothetical protein